MSVRTKRPRDGDEPAWERAASFARVFRVPSSGALSSPRDQHPSSSSSSSSNITSTTDIGTGVSDEELVAALEEVAEIIGLPSCVDVHDSASKARGGNTVSTSTSTTTLHSRTSTSDEVLDSTTRDVVVKLAVPEPDDSWGWFVQM